VTIWRGCGVFKLKSGELLHGDMHGVQCIPIDIAARVPAVASKITRREQEIVALCRSSEFSLKKLRALVSRDPI
jgi:regulator of RNase E activity RraA